MNLSNNQWIYVTNNKKEGQIKVINSCVQIELSFIMAEGKAL